MNNIINIFNYLLEGSGFGPIEIDNNFKFRWVNQTASFVSPVLPNNKRLCLIFGTPINCEVKIFQGKKLLRNINLKPGWKKIFIKINDNDKNFKIEVNHSEILSDFFHGIMLGDIYFEMFNDNMFYISHNYSNFILQENNLFISAYYYLWYYNERATRSLKPMHGGKWKEGYLRAKLSPPQYPTLGEYSSDDPAVIEAHIDWASEYGINCFICNWEGMNGHRKFLSENLVHILQGNPKNDTWSSGKIPFSQKDSTGHGWDAISQGWADTGYSIKNLKKIKFSILLESRLLLETWPPDLKNKEVWDIFGDSIIYCAENFFGSPQWHRIDGKPVLYIYEMYSWKGTKEDFYRFRNFLDSKIKTIKDPITGKTYKGLFIVADVMFSFIEPQDRFACFDAITGYNPYRSWTTSQIDSLPNEWKPLGSEFFSCDAFQNFYKKYKNWCNINNIAMIPSVIARYNDRAVRGAVDHYAFPPVSYAPFKDIEDARQAKLFINNIQCALPYVDQHIKMLNINSWNEWFEDTAIEPVGYFPDSPFPDYFGQGSNLGFSTSVGRDMDVPDKVVVYGKDGHKWIDTPEELKISGLDLTQGYEWPCYGFDYLIALSNFLSGK